MIQYTEIQKIRVSKEIKHYLDVLKTVYKINSSQFIRQVIIEKLKKDVPEIRKKHEEENKEYCPF